PCRTRRLLPAPFSTRKAILEGGVGARRFPSTIAGYAAGLWKAAQRMRERASWADATSPVPPRMHVVRGAAVPLRRTQGARHRSAIRRMDPAAQGRLCPASRVREARTVAAI